VTTIKFCGLTRRGDVAFAKELGAAYVGVIFAGGPRNRTPEQATRMLGTTRQPLAEKIASVGVFGPVAPTAIARTAAAVGLDVIQLHDGADEATVAAVRTASGRPVWAVLRCEGDRIPVTAARLVHSADGLLLDTFVAGRLGGTGVPLPWEALAAQIASLGPLRRLILAGGLTPENVGEAIAAIHPDVVDVSSGVERAPGVKDHTRMRAFADAVTAADAATAHVHR
jgi:phosphoribosylanthranilate isomerase